MRCVCTCRSVMSLFRIYQTCFRKKQSKPFIWFCTQLKSSFRMKIHIFRETNSKGALISSYFTTTVLLSHNIWNLWLVCTMSHAKYDYYYSICHNNKFSLFRIAYWQQTSRYRIDLTWKGNQRKLSLKTSTYVFILKTNNAKIPNLILRNQRTNIY